MKGSKLEKYIAILEIISASLYPLRISEIQKTISLDPRELERALSFLIEQKAINQEQYGFSTTFTIQPLGFRVIEYLHPQRAPRYNF